MKTLRTVLRDVFLQRLFEHGSVSLRDKPAVTPEERNEAAALLARTFALVRLDVAGPLIEFDAPLALAAAELVQHACWFLVSHLEPDAEVELHLRLPHPPRSASEHLSVDLTFRYLPQVYRRSRGIAPDDILTQRLAHLLREWPLSGVLADLEDAPATDLDFARHDGLRLLYAERLVRHEKPEWIPVGRTREWRFTARWSLCYGSRAKPRPLSAWSSFGMGLLGVSRSRSSAPIP